MSGQTQEVPTLSEQLAGRLERAVDQAARTRAALHLLDWTGCAVAGAGAVQVASLRAVAGGGRDDALYLGALGNVLEMDDVDKRALLHPGPVVVPAALASAGGSGADDFLDALVRGYEAMIRLGRAVGPEHYRFWHNTATCGPIGAAAAAASLLGLTRQQTAGAIELAATQAGGFWQLRHEPASHAKQLHSARAAQTGVLAARLSAAGCVGVRTIFEGPQGFFAAACAGADPHAIMDFADDAPWAMHEVSFKPWPACRHAHAAIDAALALRAGALDSRRILSVTVRGYRDAIVFCDRPTPRTESDAKFSLQHAVAAAIIRGAPTLADFTPAAIDDPAIAALRARIIVREDARLTRRYPSRFGAGVDIATTDGALFGADVDDALGDPENPASEALLLDKAHRLMRAGGMSQASAAGLAEAALGLAQGGALSEYRSLLYDAVRA